MKLRRVSDSPYAKLNRANKTNTGDTCYDLYVLTDTVLEPLTPVAIPHGVAIACPEGFGAEIRPRSSSLYRKVPSQDGLPDSICPLYIPVGTIDNPYRGELMTGVINLGSQPLTLRAGDRISQLAIVRVYTFDNPNDLTLQGEWVDELDETERGVNGFGSTGR